MENQNESLIKLGMLSVAQSDAYFCGCLVLLQV